MLAAAAAQFPAQPGLGFEQSGPVQPGGQGVVGRKAPGLAGQRRKHILGNLLCRAGVLHFASRSAVDQGQVPFHQQRKRRLVSVARKRL